MALIQRLLSWIFSSIGLVWQLYYISQQYFEYIASTQIYFNKLTTISVPRLAIISIGIVSLPSNTSLIDESNSNREWYFNYKYSPQPKQLILNCSNFAKSGVGRTDCGQITKSVGIQPVYTINYKNNLSRLKRYSFTRWTPLYQVSLNSSLVNANDTYLYARVKPSDVDSFAEEDNYATLPVRNYYDSFFGLSYDYAQIVLFPPPYNTNCFNYKTAGLESRDHCYENCVFHAANRNNIVSDMTFLRHSLDYQPINSMITDFDCLMNTSQPQESDQIICDLKLRSECRQVCKRKDCFKEVFKVNIEDMYYTASANGELKFDIEVYAATSLSTLVECVAKISSIDYITYVLSCISFWLGVSPLGTLLQFDLNRLKHKISRLFAKINALESHARRGDITHHHDNVHKVDTEVHSCQCLCRRNLVENIAIRNQMHVMRGDMRIVQETLKDVLVKLNT